jgi:hypothetical protein
MLAAFVDRFAGLLQIPWLSPWLLARAQGVLLRGDAAKWRTWFAGLPQIEV